jgi:hypothetical protein
MTYHIFYFTTHAISAAAEWKWHDRDYKLYPLTPRKGTKTNLFQMNSNIQPYTSQLLALLYFRDPH